METPFDNPWYTVEDAGDIPSPALLVYPDRVEENIRRMIAAVGEPGRLRPHMKTHKMSEIIRLQVRHGIVKCKCATIAEAEMAARSGATDILLALQPVGPNVRRLLALMRLFPGAEISTIVDSPEVVRQIGEVAGGARPSVYLDLNCGMNRTGIAPGNDAYRLYTMICATPGVKPGGLHVYDGHLRDRDPGTRRRLCDAAFAPVLEFAQRLRRSGLPVPVIVAGGTPTFPFHAAREGVEPSPGTTLLWDEASQRGCPDLQYQLAALVFSRVVSKPADGILCLDLGHKAVAAEMPHPRVTFIGLEDARPLSHSEEHLVLEVSGAARYGVGDCLYGIPTHICPTVARYERAYVIENRRLAGEWLVEARDRILTI